MALPCFNSWPPEPRVDPLKPRTSWSFVTDPGTEIRNPTAAGAGELHGCPAGRPASGGLWAARQNVGPATLGLISQEKLNVSF